ncbi:MAG: hypothetical protein HY517_03325 [Candidatus Aenigmarchaeota archaeon]|nr:hypothetical protein [Candidatus Aenigmarchaeota archaeon]
MSLKNLVAGTVMAGLAAAGCGKVYTESFETRIPSHYTCKATIGYTNTENADSVEFAQHKHRRIVKLQADGLVGAEFDAVSGIYDRNSKTISLGSYVPERRQGGEKALEVLKACKGAAVQGQHFQ